MAAVEGDDQVRVEPIRQNGDRGIHRPQWEVRVALDEVGDEGPILQGGRLDLERAQASRERGLAAWPKAQSSEVGNLGDDEGRDDEVQITPAKHLGASDVIGIPAVERRQQWPGINDRG